MKTRFKSIAKDNIATAAVMAAMFFAIVGAIADGTDAPAGSTANQPPIQMMETISVTAPRDEVVKLGTILVTASREAKFLIVPN